MGAVSGVGAAPWVGATPWVGEEVEGELSRRVEGGGGGTGWSGTGELVELGRGSRGGA